MILFIEPLISLFVEYLVDRRDAAPPLIYKYCVTGIQQNESSGDAFPQIPGFTGMNHPSPNFKEPLRVLTPNRAYASPGHGQTNLSKSFALSPKIGQVNFQDIRNRACFFIQPRH